MLGVRDDMKVNVASVHVVLANKKIPQTMRYGHMIFFQDVPTFLRSGVVTCMWPSFFGALLTPHMLLTTVGIAP